MMQNFHRVIIQWLLAHNNRLCLFMQEEQMGITFGLIKPHYEHTEPEAV